jgi:hypothetical protein
MLQRFSALLVIAGFSIAVLISLGVAYAQEGEEWTRAVPISGALPGSWYPSIAVDDRGVVHAVWGVTQGDSTLYYSNYDGLAWARPVDILIGGPRNVLVIDGRNLLHMLYPTGANVVVTDAVAQQAGSSQGWNPDLQLNRTKFAVAGDLKVDEKGVLHAVWIEAQENCDKCFQAVYGQSDDSGRTWTVYRVLSQGAVLPRSIQLTLAPSGELYALWTISPGGDIPEGVAVSVSTNNGETWLEEPILIQDEKESIRQPALVVDSTGALVLIHNLGVKDETFFQTSSDRGESWSERAPIPGLFAAKTATGNDNFAVARDSANTIHLIAVGRISKNQDLSEVYHVKWDGEGWSAPATVYAGDHFIELPSLVIANGNQLHLLFSIRDRYQISGAPDSSYQVLYTTLVTDAPPATRVSLATLTPSPTVTPTEAATPTATRRPTITPSPSVIEGDPTAPNESNPQLPIIAGVVPVLAILGLVLLVNFALRRRQ